VSKTCSVGWAPYPWRRNSYEAICAEEVIALADDALYRAKAMGRNQGVGILPNEAAHAFPEAIDVISLRDSACPYVRIVKTACPAASEAAALHLETAESTDNQNP